MLFQQINRTDAEKVFITVTNSTATEQSAGYLVVFNVRNTASTGADIEVPNTSGLPAFAGVVQNTTATTTYAIASQGSTGSNVGLVQVYGKCLAYISASGGEVVTYGQVVGPVNGVSYAGSNGTSNTFMPLICLSERTGGKALIACFVRAL